MNHKNLEIENNSLMKLITLELVEQNYNAILEIIKSNYEYAKETNLDEKSPVYITAIINPLEYLNSVQYGPKKYLDDYKTSRYKKVGFNNTVVYDNITYYNIKAKKNGDSFEDLLNQNIVIRNTTSKVISFDERLSEREIIESISTCEVMTLMKKVFIHDSIYKLAIIHAMNKLSGTVSNKEMLERNMKEKLAYFFDGCERKIVSLKNQEYVDIHYSLDPIEKAVEKYVSSKEKANLEDEASTLENGILTATDKAKTLMM